MNNDSQKQIVKSTKIIGGVQFISIFVGFIRTKAVAIILGPTGVGVLGILQSITDLIRSLTGFGLNFSAVKDIAEADASNNQERLYETISVLRNLVLWTGLLGTVLTLVLAKQLGEFAFGNAKYTLSIIYISITLLLTSIAGGQMALLQGKRQIKLIASASLYGSLTSTFLSILLYYFLGINGIVPGLIISSLIPLYFSWYFARKIKFERRKFSFKITLSKGKEMVKLGYFIVISSFLASLTLYSLRKFIIEKDDIDGVGFFQASWTISTSYLGIILNAMLSDFFPRLSAINTNEIESNKLVNEQLEIALVLGTPMIIFFIAFANPIISLLYTSSFGDSVVILQWQLYGAFFTLIAWPLGVLFLAKNKGFLSVITDFLWCILFLIIVYFGWSFLGFGVLGIGDTVSLIFKVILVYFIVFKLWNFRFSNDNIKNILFYGFFSTLMIGNVVLLKGNTQLTFSLFLILIVALKSIVFLNKIYRFDKMIKL